VNPTVPGDFGRFLRKAFLGKGYGVRRLLSARSVFELLGKMGESANGDGLLRSLGYSEMNARQRLLPTWNFGRKKGKGDFGLGKGQEGWRRYKGQMGCWMCWLFFGVHLVLAVGWSVSGSLSSLLLLLPFFPACRVSFQPNKSPKSLGILRPPG